MVVAHQIGEQGANYRVWNKTVRTTDACGNPILVTNRAYVELATGLNRPDTAHPGNWIPSTPQIVPCPGGAVAQGCQHTVRFAENLNAAGAVDLTMPNGKHMVSNILGLSYYDPASGKSVLISEITNCEGQIVGSNEVLYASAFSGLNGSVLYKYTKAAFEQDVILSEQPPDPQSLGLSRNAVLQALTEFTTGPASKIRTDTVATRAGGSADETLDFGSMRMVHGRAFLLDTNSLGVGFQPAKMRTTVSKQWTTVTGRKVLVESVPLSAITNQLERLPAFSLNCPQPTNGLPLYAVSSRRILPAPKLAHTQKGEMKLAKVTPHDRGFVLDYVERNGSVGGFLFQDGTTYLIDSDGLFIDGPAVFEGGAVIKEDDSGGGGGIEVDGYGSGSVIFKSGSYNPVVFTSKDDDYQGEIIPESTGQPSQLMCNLLSVYNEA